MNHYPIAISSDTGAVDSGDKSVVRFATDTLAGVIGLNPGSLLFSGAAIGGGALIGGKKHRLLGAAIGAGVLYAIWRKGVDITSGK